MPTRPTCSRAAATSAWELAEALAASAKEEPLIGWELAGVAVISGFRLGALAIIAIADGLASIEAAIYEVRDDLRSRGT